MNEVVIASAVRTAVGKAPRGTLRTTRPDDMAATAIAGALARIPQLDRREVEDVIIGCATPEAEQGMNVAKVAAFRAGLSNDVCGMTINRYCSSGLQSIAPRGRPHQGRLRRCAGRRRHRVDVVHSLRRQQDHRQSLAGREQSGQLSLDGPDRRERGQALRHHARRNGRVLLPLAPQGARGPGRRHLRGRDCRSRRHHHGPRRKDGQVKPVVTQFTKDEGPRADTSIEGLSRLRAVFHAKGSVTAGNSSQTSDGAAATDRHEPQALPTSSASSPWPASSPSRSPAATPWRWASAPSMPSPRCSR